MALAYDSVPNGFFIQLGKIVKHYNLQRTDATDLSADLTDILDVFEAMTLGKPALITEGFATTVESWKAQHSARRASLVDLAEVRLQDKITVLDEIGASSTALEELLYKLIVKMALDAETVDASTVTIGAVAAAAANVATGTVLVTKVLDGVTSPGSGAAGTYAPHWKYKGLDSQLAVTSETMKLICTADSFIDGTDEGSEAFTWEGRLADTANGYEAEGSGPIGAIVPIHSADANHITSGDFEDWTANVPDDWTLVAGVAGTHVVEETVTANIYHGLAGLKFVGDGALASIEINQAFTADQVKGNKRYCVAVRMKADATIAAGALLISFEGTGYAPAAVTPEVQTIQISGTPTGGNYTITCPWSGLTTANIAHNANAATIQAAMRLLAGNESIVVALTAGAAPDATHSYTLHGIDGNVGQMTSTSALTGGAPVIAHATTTQGVAGEKISLPATALPTTWSLRYFWVNMPEIIPSDFKLVIRWNGTPTNTKQLWIDDLAVGAATYGGGVATAIIRGAVPFTRDDAYTFTITNDDAGLFQKFFRQAFGVQLPSDSAGGETIDDALAT